jgi:CheY-specific phosphatase CheX
MFGLYFGNYLVEKNKISQSQFEDVMLQQQKTRVKLGLIAVAEKLLTTKQAEEINEIQRKMDRRFGDIAIEKGYLLAEEVTYLLNMQGNPYLQFVQVCSENHILTIQEIENYLEEFKNDNNFSDSDLDALKSGDIDRIIPVFVDTDAPYSGECVSLTIRNIVRFINNNILLRKAYKVHDYSFGVLSSQKMVGDQEIFVGFAGKENELLAIANPFAKEEFTQMNEDAFDSVCEFINCTNGLYASKLSHEDIHIDMTPPLFYTGKKITSQGDICVVPIIINGVQADLLVAVNNQIGIN